jgi:hypothetical protein
MAGRALPGEVFGLARHWRVAGAQRGGEMRAGRSGWLRVVAAAFACMVFLGVETRAQSRGCGEEGENYALIIAPGIYEHFNPVDTSRNDAKAIVDILTCRYNFKKRNVTVLSDNAQSDFKLCPNNDQGSLTVASPSLGNINRYLDQMAGKIGDRDSLLIFYFGKSMTDTAGKTYWVPINGDNQKDNPDPFGTYISHEALCEKYLLNYNLQAMHICILTDSKFSNESLVKFREAVRYKINHGRYETLICSANHEKSRQILCSNNELFIRGSNKTMSAFAEYVAQCMEKNQYGAIAIENLIFDVSNEKDYAILQKKTDESIVNQRAVRRCQVNKCNDNNGLCVLTQHAPLATFSDDVAYSYKEDGDGYHIYFSGSLNGSCAELGFTMNGRSCPPGVSGSAFTFGLPVDGPGTYDCELIAYNEEGNYSRPDGIYKVPVTIPPKKVPAKPAAVITKTWPEPDSGYPGQAFRISAETDIPVTEMFLATGGTKVKMDGSGTVWSHTLTVATPGEYSYTVQTGAGVNDGSFKVAAPAVEVLSVTISPQEVYAGGHYKVTAQAGEGARAVVLSENSQTREMTKQGNLWVAELTAGDPGDKIIEVTAKNPDGEPGKAARGEFKVLEAKTPPPDIAEVVFEAKAPASGTSKDNIEQDKMEVGESYSITARTNNPATSASVRLGDGSWLNMEPKDDQGKKFVYKGVADKEGAYSYTVQATGKDGKIKGNPKRGSFEVIAKPREIAATSAPLITIKSFVARPDKGKQGDTFTFEVVTEHPTNGGVALNIGGHPHNIAMNGGSIKWLAKDVQIEEAGIITCKASASNGYGVWSKPSEIEIAVGAVPVTVLKVDVSPDPVVEHKEFVVSATLDRLPKTVEILMDGEKSKMEKKTGKVWEASYIAEAPGKKEITVVALNAEGERSKAVSKTLQVEEKRVELVEVRETSAKPNFTGANRVGDSFNVSAKTSSAASKVYLLFAGKEIPMVRQGLTWSSVIKAGAIGETLYGVVALNEKGERGAVKDGKFTVEPPLPPPGAPNVIRVDVPSQSVVAGEAFTVTVRTDKAAQRVELRSGSKTLDLAKAGEGLASAWKREIRLRQSGSFEFTAQAFDAGGKGGDPRKITIEVSWGEMGEQRYADNGDGTLTDMSNKTQVERFRDNGDGTVTDLLKGLMWRKRPLDAEYNFADAVSVCYEFREGPGDGWRLPTYAEWETITDMNAKGVALNPNAPFRGVSTSCNYWSKTDSGGNHEKATMNLRYGTMVSHRRTDTACVWPVRRAD